MQKWLYLFTEKLVTPILIFLLLLALVVGLWPFSFTTKNNIQWLGDQNGLLLNPPNAVSDRGIIFTEVKINLNQNQDSKIPNLSFTFWLKAESYYDRYIGSLLTLEDGKDHVAVLFGQWKSSLIIRFRSDFNEWGYREVGVADALVEGEESFITINSSKMGIKIYVNGKLKKSYGTVALLDSDIGPVQLVAGSSVSGVNRWKGKVFGLAIYSDTLSAGETTLYQKYWRDGNINSLGMHGNPLLLYPFEERKGDVVTNAYSDSGHFLIPSQFHILRKPFLGIPYIDKYRIYGSMVEDVLINLSGFILLGFFMALFFAKKLNNRMIIVLTTFVLCSVLSLGIEYLQVGLPQRDSSLLDFLLNSGGSLIGGIIWVFEVGKRGKG